ncbi:MAG: O-acetyl-ADP-ribose deacetylase [bacterium]|nr:O-acetyl-ADP-ribose deacetylase [bacterium]
MRPILKKRQINKSTLTLLQGDITNETTDAIVNAANSSLMGGGGVDGAIHRAGGGAILEECKDIRAKQGNLPTGKAVITTGGNLKAKYVIHTVGPIWHGGNQGEAELLKSAYLESLKMAVANNCSSITFPSISTGVYGYPKEKAAPIALETVIDFLKTDVRIKEVRFVLFDSQTFAAYNQALLILEERDDF